MRRALRANLGRGGLTLPIRGVAALNVPCALQAGMRPEGYEARGCALQAGMRPEGYQARLASVGGVTGVNHYWVKPAGPPWEGFTGRNTKHHPQGLTSGLLPR